MTCHDVHGLLPDWVAGDLPHGTREVFARHLEACESCRAYVDSYEKTIAVAKRAERGETDAAKPPEALESAILASLKPGFRARNHAPRPQGRRGPS